MAVTNKNKLNPGWVVLVVLMGLIDLALLLIYLTRGKNIALFNPQGLIAQDQHNLLVYTVTVLFAIAIPAIFFVYFIAWKYRESNKGAKRTLKIRQGKVLVFCMWLIPIVGIFLIARAMLPATHKLSPHKAISSNVKPLTIQVISMNWKWLFLYPDQNIASVNFVQIPVNTPIIFKLTADESPMSSFWIPNLSGQLYSMTSHVNQLNILAESIGDYPGKSAELNGPGFAGMKFTARVSSAQDFDQWVQVAKQYPSVLDIKSYQKLLKPSQNNPAVIYSAYDNNLYNDVLSKYSGSHGGHVHNE